MSDTGRMSAPASESRERTLYGLLAEYETTDQLLAAAARVRDAGYARWDTHTPIPIHGLDEAMGIRRSVLPFVVFACGAAGAAAGLGLQWFTNAFNYPFLISGKPFFSLPAFIPVAFELTILLAACGAFFGMLLLNGLPRLYHQVFHNRRFSARCTTDRFYISIEAADPGFDEGRTRALLEATGGAVERIESYDEPLPAVYRKWVIPALAIAASVAVVPPMLLLRARAATHETTRLQLIPNMDRQPKWKAQAAAPFADGRAMRPPVAGAVARGEAMIDSTRHTGIEDATWVAQLPVPLDAALLRRGQARFGVFCAQCHGLDGYGRGPVALRADQLQEGTWIPPSSLHDDNVRGRADGHLFNTITHGIRSMPPYGDQIPVEDRWAIVAYVRALQRSQNARLEDVPPEDRDRLRRE